MKTKEIALEIKGLTEEGTFEGYASTFGNIDRYGEKVLPGAFVDSLAARRREGTKVKLLFNHDMNQPIGHWEDLAEDAKGLWGQARLVMDVPKAREVHALMKAGSLDSLSIGYREIEADQEGGVRMLRKLDLFEISVATVPVNARARVTAVKSDDAMAVIIEKLAAGERLTEREFERMAKGLGLTNSQAERAARVHLKGQGEPADAENGAVAFLRALRGQTSSAQ